MILTPSTCPTCGDQLSTPIRSRSKANTYMQTCRNAHCMKTIWIVVEVAEEPRPRPVSLPLAPAPPRQAAPAKSAIETFERAYANGDARKAIRGQRRQLRAASVNDGRLKQAGGNA